LCLYLPPAPLWLIEALLFVLSHTYPHN
jgi:hypothetical protein